MSSDPAPAAGESSRPTGADAQDPVRRAFAALVLPPVPAPGWRRMVPFLALASGLAAGGALVAGLIASGRGTIPLLIASLALALGATLSLTLRLRSERMAARELGAAIERLEDENWKLEEARAGVPTGGITAGFEPVLTIATVSHELRAPLSGMRGLADLLAETELSTEQRAYVEALGQSTDALGRVVDDLLDASRIATGHFALDSRPTAIEPLVEQVADLMAAGAFSKGLSLSIRVAPSLPMVETDAGRLRQVLINLVANAIAFSETGGVVIAAEPIERTGGDWILRLSVADSGRGIDPADRERIFGRFERGGGGGAGLGLAISSRIVEHMGSRLTLSPSPQGGSTFALDLPMPAVARWGLPDADILAGHRILVALRSAAEAESVAIQLAGAHAEATKTTERRIVSSLLGAAAAAGEPFDTVLFDIGLSDEPHAVPAQMRAAADRGIAVVALIEPSDRRQIPALRGAGFDAYLVRPVRRASLLRVARAVTRPGHDFTADPVDRPAAAERLLALVVEDDPVGALLVRSILERLGHDVIEARSGAAARAVLAGRAVDLILIDLTLGSEDGAALIKSLRESAPQDHRPVLIAMSADDERLLGAGADVALAKPVTPDSLRHAISLICKDEAPGKSLRHQTV